MWNVNKLAWGNLIAQQWAFIHFKVFFFSLVGSCPPSCWEGGKFLNRQCNRAHLGKCIQQESFQNILCAKCQPVHTKSFGRQNKQSSTLNFAAGSQYRKLDFGILGSEFDGLGLLGYVSPFLGAACLVNKFNSKTYGF